MVEKRQNPPAQVQGVKENCIQPGILESVPTQPPPTHPCVHLPLPVSCEPEGQIRRSFLGGHTCVPDAICPRLCAKQLLSLENPPGKTRWRERAHPNQNLEENALRAVQKPSKLHFNRNSWLKLLGFHVGFRSGVRTTWI